MNEQEQQPTEGAPNAPPEVPPFVIKNRLALEKIMVEPMRKPFSEGPSLADLLEWNAVPAEIQRLARRIILGGLEHEGNESALEMAFKEGWEQAVEACRDAMEFRDPLYERRDFEDWLRENVRERGAA